MFCKKRCPINPQTEMSDCSIPDPPPAKDRFQIFPVIFLVMIFQTIASFGMTHSGLLARDIKVKPTKAKGCL